MIPISTCFLQSNFSKEKHSGFSNQTFGQFVKSTNLANIYIPAYMRIKVKNIKSLSLFDFESELNLTINFDIYIQALTPQLQIYLKENIMLFFLRNDPVNLGQNKDVDLTVKMQSSYITFTLRKIIKAKVQPFIFFTPLQLLDLVMTINVRPIRYQVPIKTSKGSQQKYLTINLHVNFMSTEIQEQENSQYNIEVCMSHSKNILFGKYKIANKRMFPQYTSSLISHDLMQLGKCFYLQSWLSPNTTKAESETTYIQRDQSQLNIKSFHYSHFHIPLCKDPWVSILVIYLPLMILGVINMSIFYQDQVLSDRLANIATLLIAIVGMISIVRQQIPPSPLITLTEIIVLLESLACMTCLLSTLIIKNNMESQQLEKPFIYTQYTDITFWLAFILTAIVFAVPILMGTFHHFSLYNSHSKEDISDNRKDFHFGWNGNLEADRNFFDYFIYFKKQSKYKSSHETRFICELQDLEKKKAIIEKLEITQQKQKVLKQMKVLFEQASEKFRQEIKNFIHQVTSQNSN